MKLYFMEIQVLYDVVCNRIKYINAKEGIEFRALKSIQSKLEEELREVSKEANDGN